MPNEWEFKTNSNLNLNLRVHIISFIKTNSKTKQKFIKLSYVMYPKLLENLHQIYQNLDRYLLIKNRLTNLAISKRRRTNFSDSPLYFEVSVLEDTLKKVVPHSVATA